MFLREVKYKFIVIYEKKKQKNKTKQDFLYTTYTFLVIVAKPSVVLTHSLF